jgi:hypothetical protein
MKLYARTTEQFRADARMHWIAEKLRAEYTTQIGHRPAPSEVASWQNSLMALSMLVLPQLLPLIRCLANQAVAPLDQDAMEDEAQPVDIRVQHHLVHPST